MVRIRSSADITEAFIAPDNSRLWLLILSCYHWGFNFTDAIKLDSNFIVIDWNLTVINFCLSKTDYYVDSMMSSISISGSSKVHFTGNKLQNHYPCMWSVLCTCTTTYFVLYISFRTIIRRVPNVTSFVQFFPVQRVLIKALPQL